MANPLHAKSAVSDSLNICNAESETGFISRSQVLELIERQRAAFEYLNVAGGLSPDSACRYTRERFEIVAGKILALNSIAGLIRQLVPRSGQFLMAEKPSSSFSSAVGEGLLSVLSVVERRREDARREALFHADPDSRGMTSCHWTAADAKSTELAALAAELIEKFSGSAEEQPERREESRPVMGNSPVTPAATNPRQAPEKPFPGVARNFLDWCGLNIDGLTSKELGALSELALEELEARGTVESWQVAG